MSNWKNNYCMQYLYRLLNSFSKSIGKWKKIFCRGDYVFYHYMQDGFDDKGWGCAYRSFQSVLSWLIENGYTNKKDIPNHKRIQQILVEMRDKQIDFVGMKQVCQFHILLELNEKYQMYQREHLNYLNLKAILKTIEHLLCLMVVSMLTLYQELTIIMMIVDSQYQILIIQIMITSNQLLRNKEQVGERQICLKKSIFITFACLQYNENI